MSSCKNCAFWKLEQEEIGEYIYLNIFRCSNEVLKEQLCKYNYSLYTQIKEDDNCSMFIRVGDIVNKEEI